jgi:mercuric ion transport protein
VEFKIKGMTCQGCAEHVMFEVNKLAGIIKTNASFENGNALVEFDESKVSQGSIESAINSTGYKVVEVVRLR